MHGDELVVAVGIDEGENAGESKLQPHQPGKDKRNEADRNGCQRILDGDDFGVLAEDVGRPPAMRVIKLHIFDFRCRNGVVDAGWNIDHLLPSLCSLFLPKSGAVFTVPSAVLRMLPSSV